MDVNHLPWKLPWKLAGRLVFGYGFEPMSRLAAKPVSAPATSLVADAYRALKEAIRDTTLAPGYQGSEQEIALRLGMSRTPVHEALIRLQEEGMVRILAKRGVQVLALSPDDMREIYDVIIALEGAAAELIAVKPEAERRRIAAELDAIDSEMKAALQRDDRDDREAWARADDRFHRALIEQSGNGRLARLANTTMDQGHRARMMTLRLRAKPTKSAKEHQAIVKAIRSGDAAAAGGHAKAHRLRARDELLPLLEQLGMKQL